MRSRKLRSRHGNRTPPPHLRRFAKLNFFSFVFRNSGGIDTVENCLGAPCIQGFQGMLEGLK